METGGDLFSTLTSFGIFYSFHTIWQNSIQLGETKRGVAKFPGKIQRLPERILKTPDL